MNIGSRLSLWKSDDVSTAKLYIQDGLFALYDGIENAGWGKHNSNMPIDLVGGMGNLTLTRPSAHMDENSIVISDNGRLIPPSYSIGNHTLTMQLCIVRDSGEGEYGAVWENPWFGINLLSQSWVRFTCGADVDYRNMTTNIPTTYTLVRDTSVCKFYKGETLLGQRSISISNINTNNLGIGVWQDGSGEGRYMNGHIYCLRIYDHPLSDADVVYNYEIDKERFGLT